MRVRACVRAFQLAARRGENAVKNCCKFSVLRRDVAGLNPASKLSEGRARYCTAVLRNAA